VFKKGDKVRYKSPSCGRTFVVMKVRGKIAVIGRKRGDGTVYECETPLYNLERVEEKRVS